MRVALVAAIVAAMASFPASAQVLPDPVEAEGTVLVESPLEFQVTPGETTSFFLHVTGEIECVAGYGAPQPAAVNAEHGVAHTVGDLEVWRLDPWQFEVEWTQDADGIYRIDDMVEIQVVSEGPWSERLESVVTWGGLRSAGDGMCAPGGHSIEATSGEMLLFAEPAATEGASVDNDTPAPASLVVLGLLLAMLVRRPKHRF